MSSPNQSEGDRARDEVLAGEYVLGVLSPEGRARVEARIRRDRAFAAIVARWEQNLAPLADDYEALSPPDFIVPMVERRMIAARQKSLSRPFRGRSLWASLGLWRTLTFVFGFLFAGVLFFSTHAPAPAIVPPPMRPLADLKAQDNPMSLAARYDSGEGRLRLAPVATAGSDQQSLEVWAIETNAAPVSLGVLPQAGDGELIVSKEWRGRLKPGVTLAVSREAYGGSLSGRPTGAFVASGTVSAP